MKLRTFGTGLGAAALLAAVAALMAGLAGERGALVANEPVSASATSRPAADPWAKPERAKRSALFYDRFETIGRADGLPSDRVTSVLADGDLLVVGTDDGLAVRRGGKWTVLGEKDGLAHRYVTSVSRDAATGDVWIGTLRGLTRLSGDALRTFRQTDSGLMNDVVYHVLCEGPLVWVATAAGVSCLDTRTGGWALYDVKNSIMHEPWCYALAVGPERAWIGVWGGGVCELDRRTGLWKEYRDPDGEMEIDLLKDDGPIHEVTSFVAYDDGVLWQGSYFGLARYDGRRWTSYTAADTGLPGDFINHVAARGTTSWISTDQGLGVFDGETCVSYRRAAGGACDVRVWRGGREAERRTLATAPADDYVLWAQGGETDVWIATGRGLSHGVAERVAPSAGTKER
jgi:ligand-binding sensor domain-containing protein